MQKRAVVWALVDQGFSSGTNFLLVLLAARTLGPAGLGMVTIGFAVTLLYLGIVQRSLVTDAITVKASAAPAAERIVSTRSGLTVLLVAGIAATLALFAASIVAPDPFAASLGAFAPWIAGVSVQDYWRYTLFREDRGLAAIVNDMIWLAAMALATLALWPLRSPAEVVAVWGIGATAGAVTGVVQTRVRPVPLLASLRWWRREMWPLARWFGADRLAAGVATNGATLIVAALVGTSDLGGLRAVESLFAPLTLLIPAVSLPGLPAVTRAMRSSRPEGGRLALRLSALVAGIVGAYFTVLLAIEALHGSVLGTVFGRSFERFAGLIMPIAVAQVVLACAFAAILVLKATQQGRRLVEGRVAGAITSVAAVTGLTAGFGVAGAAWGAAMGALTGTIVLSVFAFGPTSGGSTVGERAVSDLESAPPSRNPGVSWGPVGPPVGGPR